MTSDGITSSDWDAVHQLALQIANAHNDAAESYRQELLRYLQQLEQKYGELPSILATQADYASDRSRSEELLLRAEAVAVKLGDVKNAIYTRLSLAQLYANELANADRGRLWLNRAQELSDQWEKADYDEYREIELALEQLTDSRGSSNTS